MKKINYKKEFTLRNSKGFTLIELLVVVAIIGILASVVLASLSTAKGKGLDASIKSQMKSMTNQAELYTGTGAAFAIAACAVGSSTGNAGFDTIFEGTAGKNGLASLFKGITLSTTRCYAAAGKPSNGTAWVVAVPLSTGVWCVDSTGVSRDKTSAGVAYTMVFETPISGTNVPAITTTGVGLCR